MTMRVFNNANVIPDAWFWALPSCELKKGAVVTIDLFGSPVNLHRDAKNNVTASAKTALRVAERFGMIWVHVNVESSEPLPSFPELEGKDTVVRIDDVELRNCHPTLILGGGVDEEHFLFVHKNTTDISGPLCFQFERLSSGVIRYWNIAPIGGSNLKSKVMRALYNGVLTYDVSYWYGSTALARLGPRWLPLFSIFAYRPTGDGKTVGRNIYVTERGRGIFRIFERVRLALTRAILRKGGAEDARIQNSIQFKVGPFSLLNKPFGAFVRYVEEQPHFLLSDLKIEKRGAFK